MRKSVSSDYNIFAQAAGKTIHWKVSIKKTNSLSESHSEGTWIDVTDYMSNESLDTISCSTETEDGKIKSDELKLTGLDIIWWKANIFDATDYLEVKIEFWINNLTADTMVLFSGWIDKLHDVFVTSCDEKKNTIQFKVNSYLEYAERLSGVKLCTQVKNDSINGVLLQKINGIFVTNTNVTGYVLEKGIHILNYDYNSGTERIQLDGGAWVILPTSDGTSTLTNADGDQKIEIYTIVSILSSTNSNQDIIVINQGDTLPYTWYRYYFVFYLLKQLFTLIGLTNYSFDDFRITTRDGRYTTSFYEIPPGDSFYSIPQTLYWDTANNILWIGIGNKIYKRNMTTHQYTLVGQLPSSSGYSVERFFPERIANGELWGIALKWGYNARVFRVTISTSSISAWDLTHHNNYSGDEIWKLKNIAFAPSYGSAGSLFYFDYGAAPNSQFWIFDCATATESMGKQMAYNVQARVSWSTGSDLYYFRWNGSSNDAIEQLVYSGGTWNLYSKLSTNHVNGGVYSSAENKVYGSSLTNAKLFVYNISANTYTEFGSYRGRNFEVYSTTVYFQNETTGQPTTLVSGVETSLTGDAFTLPTGSTISDKFLLSVNVTDSRIYTILGTSGLLAMYSPSISMFIEEEVDGEGSSLIDIIKDLTVGYLLRARVSTTKQCHILRRIDQSGNIITSGYTVVLNADNVSNLNENNGSDVSDVVEVRNQDDETNYDGSNYDIACINNERIYSVDNNYIPSRLLKDYAHWIYQYVHHVRNKIPIETPLLPFFQYEPFDGASLIFSGKIVINKTGIILSQTMTKLGKTEFEVEVFNE